jgi:single-stranded-DNA-specific exonuclease
MISAEVGGAGGGHDIAAGATIPDGKKEEFTQKLDLFIGEQIRRKVHSK